MGCVSSLGSRSIDVLVDIHNIEIHRGMVAPLQVVGCTIELFDVTKLECQCIGRFCNERGRRDRSAAWGIGSRHSNAVAS